MEENFHKRLSVLHSQTMFRAFLTLKPYTFQRVKDFIIADTAFSHRRFPLPGD